GFGSGSGNLRYREIQNSNWRSRCEEQAVNNIKSSQEIPVRQNAGNEDIPNLTCEEYDGIPFNERPSRPAQCMSVIIGFDDNKIRSSTPASKLPCDEGLTLESYLNLSNQKKRPRPMNIGDVLNDDEHTAKISKNATRRKRRAEKQLREIVGRLGQGPVNYKKLAEEIKVEVSLMDLFQISPDMTKAFKKLSTRVNEKTMKERMRRELPVRRETENNDLNVESEGTGDLENKKEWKPSHSLASDKRISSPLALLASANFIRLQSGKQS
ncbi:hypothetical protein K3495_g16295, partial [Podosphaera aphanis]